MTAAEMNMRNDEHRAQVERLRLKTKEAGLQTLMDAFSRRKSRADEDRAAVRNAILGGICGIVLVLVTTAVVGLT